MNTKNSNKTFIVAEVGNNHEGSFDNAKRLVEQAAAAGVDAVKFQTFRTEHFLGKKDLVRYERYKKFELTIEQFYHLNEMARELGIIFFSTPLDLDSAKALNQFVPLFKIASGDNNFIPLIDYVVGTGKPIIISSGASTLDEIIEMKRNIQTKLEQVPRLMGNIELGFHFAILHCVSSYPAAASQLNLRAIRAMKESLAIPVGYSDHAVGINACLAAVAAGASIIEKHFTLDKNFSDFRDHQLSADPNDMREMVQRIREIEEMLGDGVKKIENCEAPLRTAIRRSVVAKQDLKKGSILSAEQLDWIRPGGGILPGNEHLIIGKKAKIDLAVGDQLQPEQFE